MRLHAALLAGLLLAGCAGSAVDAPPRSLDGVAAYGARDVPPEAPATPRVLPTGAIAVEPSIGITKNGTLLVVANTDVIRSWDAGATWDVVQSAPGTTFDPWLSVDPITDRVFVDHLTLACTNIAWSDDAGATWSPFSPVGCGAPVTDFQKLAHGRPGPEATRIPVLWHPSMTYICYNKVVGTFGLAPSAVERYGTACAASYDGGATFHRETVLGGHVQGPAGPLVEGCFGGSWGPAVGPDGTVVVRAQPDCLYRSRDSGESWQEIGTGPPFQGTQFAFDEEGTLYALSAYWEPPLRMARSMDQGETWSEPWVVAPPDVSTVAFTALVAGDAGRVAVAFLGAPDAFADAHDAPDDTRWDAWIVAIEDADAQPAMVAYRATPPEAPMHVGCISRAPPCPFMGDFVTMAKDPAGLPYVVFPDTCNEGCEGNADATMADTGDVLATVVRLEGWSLLSTAAPLAS